MRNSPSNMTTHAPTLAADFARLEVLSGSVLKALRRDPMRRAICEAFASSLEQMGRTVRATQQHLERLERLECLAKFSVK